MADNIKVGIIGCGNISGAYFQTNTQFNFFDIVACADLDLERAKMRAQEFNIPKACTPEELLADPDINFVISLTIPQAHGPVMLAGVQSGKSVYTEKPFTVTRHEAQQVLATAKANGLRVGSAPDTFLGGSHQTCREIIDSGEIGEPIAATAFMAGHGHENWHPSPQFYYQKGGGPMFDMGPYYLTALVNLLGPARRVSGSTRITFPTRTITSEPLNGTEIEVEVPTHIAGIVDFKNGAIATMITSFDTWAHNLPLLEIYGTKGTLSVPDPNGFGGVVRVRKSSESDWREVPVTRPYTANARGIGMADMALAMQNHRPHRANGELAYHVLDIMHAFHDSSDENRHIELASTCERPEILPQGLQEGELEI